MPGSTPPAGEAKRLIRAAEHLADTVSGLQQLARSTDETRGAAEAVQDVFTQLQAHGFEGPALDLVKGCLDERQEAHRRATEQERAFLAGELVIPRPVPSPDQVGAYRAMRMFTDGP